LELGAAHLVALSLGPSSETALFACFLRRKKSSRVAALLAGLSLLFAGRLFAPAVRARECLRRPSESAPEITIGGGSCVLRPAGQAREPIELGASCLVVWLVVFLFAGLLSRFELAFGNGFGFGLEFGVGLETGNWKWNWN